MEEADQPSESKELDNYILLPGISQFEVLSDRQVSARIARTPLVSRKIGALIGHNEANGNSSHF